MTTATAGVWASSASAPVRADARLPWPVWILCAFLFLVTVFGKGPTYLGIPPLFIGEIVLAVSVVWMVNRYGLQRALLADESLLACLIVLFMALGAVLTARCLGENGIDAIRDAAIWYYAAFFFVGHAIGSDVRIGPLVWRSLAIAWGFALVWGTVDQLMQMTLGWGVATLGPVLPWRGEPLFFNSNYEEVQQMGLAGLLVLHPRLHQGHLGKWQKPLAAVGVLALGLVAIAHGRGVKVGLALAAGMLAILHFAPGRPLQISKRTVAAILILVIVVGCGVTLFADDFLQVTKLDRFVGADPSAPSGTAYWRVIWWRVLWQEVNSRNPLFGLGFGQSLSIYNPYLVGDELNAWPVRSPHNFNITVFSRMGFAGLAVWLSVLAAGVGGLFLLVWRGRGEVADPLRREELAFWIVLLVATWGNGSFGVLMEGPVLGIWFWFALGFAHGRSKPAHSKWEMA